MARSDHADPDLAKTVDGLTHSGALHFAPVKKKELSVPQGQRALFLMYKAIQWVGNSLFIPKTKDGKKILWSSQTVVDAILARFDQFVFHADQHCRKSFKNAIQDEWV